MCGIVGFVAADPRALAPREAVVRMAATLEHRGPDSFGFEYGAGVALGVRRLAIVDLAHGDQPIAVESGCTLVANCEIYNAPELRARLIETGHRFNTLSDAEPIAHLYEERGLDALAELRGMFAFALWDPSAGRLVLARDRLGIKPLFYAATDDGLWFASEQKALLAVVPEARRADLSALGEALSLGFVSAPRSLFAGIRQLEPGGWLVYERGGTRLGRYWRLPSTVSANEPAGTLDDWASALRSKLEDAVRLHLRSDVPVAAWLSPGIDSSGVVALAQRLGQPLETFSLTFTEDPADEIAGTDPLAGLGEGVTNECVPFSRGDLAMLPALVRCLESPLVFGVELPRYVLARRTAERYKVVLTGEGADELFGGYRWIRAYQRRQRLARLPRPVVAALGLGARAVGRPGLAARHRGRGFDGSYWAELLRPGRGHVAALLSADLAAEFERPPDIDAEAAAATTDEQLLHRLDMTRFLPGLILPAVDRTTMAHSLEGRVPYLDHELVELCAAAPATFKQPQPMEKMLLRRALRGVLPDSTLKRPKRAFRLPETAWLAGGLPEFAAELLTPAALRESGYFDERRVGALLARPPVPGDQPPARALLAVLGVQLWHATFIERS